MILNRGQLADVLGKSEPHIDKLIREGMPVLARPQRNSGERPTWQFDSGACIEWYVKYRGPTAAKASEKEAVALRLMKADVTIAEVKAAVALKSVVLVSDAVRLFEEKTTVVKSLVRAVPGRVAVKLAGESDPAKVLIILKTELNSALAGVKNVVLAEGVKDLAADTGTDEDSMPVAVLIGPEDAPEADPYDGY